MKIQVFRKFTKTEQKTWKTLFDNLVEVRRTQAVPLFQTGLDFLGMNADQIPDLFEVNRRLRAKTGWQGVPVEGLEEGVSFYPGLAERIYPIGNFIRDAQDVNYTPAPDIFHDLYGHIPFFIDERYADFNWRYGNLVSKYMNDPRKLQRYERFYWFTVEFALMETPPGRRIFGAGLLSSLGEATYALSPSPEVRPFEVLSILRQDYRIDEFQNVLFLLQSENQLYESLPELERLVNQECP